MNGTTAEISGNHGHSISVSKADIAAGVDKPYDIKGAADHSHTVTITASQFAMLTGNTTVMKLSGPGSTDGHTHTVTIICL